MRSYRTSCVAVIAMVTGSLGVAASAAFAAPVQWSGNGHYYERVEEVNLTWNEAKAHAESRTHLGQSGYLVTITSPGEQDFIEQNMLILQELAVWAGGYEPAVDAGWVWVTEEPWVYTNWGPSEPDPGPESFYLNIFQYPESKFGGWNDANPWDPSAGYIVEYVPEPLTVLLLAVGGLSLLRRRR